MRNFFYVTMKYQFIEAFMYIGYWGFKNVTDINSDFMKLYFIIKKILYYLQKNFF